MALCHNRHQVWYTLQSWLSFFLSLFYYIPRSGVQEEKKECGDSCLKAPRCIMGSEWKKSFSVWYWYFRFYGGWSDLFFFFFFMLCLSAVFIQISIYMYLWFNWWLVERERNVIVCLFINMSEKKVWESKSAQCLLLLFLLS